MMRGLIEELYLPYEPGQLSEKVARRKRQMRSRLISLGITIVVLVAIYFWRKGEQQGAGFFAVYGVILGISLAWLLATLIGYLRARKELASIGQGAAVRMGRTGVQVAELGASWPEVASISVVKGKLGRGPALRLLLTDGRQARVPLNQIEVFPATLDSTARAYSGGHHGVDLAALDT
jgi:hypothetical protein